MLFVFTELYFKSFALLKQLIKRSKLIETSFSHKVSCNQDSFLNSVALMNILKIIFPLFTNNFDFVHSYFLILPNCVFWNTKKFVK